MKYGLIALFFLVPTFSLFSQSESESFRGQISRETLDYYLSRAVTHAGLCASHPDPTTKCLDDDIRMLTEIGARFVGRSAFAWHLPADEEGHFKQARDSAARVHQKIPNTILQACVFEIVTSEVNRIPVPGWVFEAFGLPGENRPFRYEAMLYPEGKFHNHWQPGASVPDMSQIETRMWFYYRARRYIDCGMEAIHFGQVHLMNHRDPNHDHWYELLSKIRKYGKEHGRRELVLCDAHTHGILRNGELLFDFHSYPLRIREIPGKPMETKLSADDFGDIVTHSRGGKTVHGWSCESLPYLVEFDNYGYSGRGGTSVGGIWVWGYDEISWFAHLDKDKRKQWIYYAYRWLNDVDPVGHLQLPTRRILAAPVGKINMFSANRKSDDCPDEFALEDAIRELWEN